MKSVVIVVSPARHASGEERALRTIAAEGRSAGATIVTVPYGAGTPYASFGAAANAGARDAGGEVLVFIDGAVPVPATGWLQPLLAALCVPGVRVAGPRIVTGSTAEECGLFVCSSPSPRGFDFQGLAGVREPMACDALPSDCLITTRAAFDELGGFAETFGSALEGIDFCLRAGEDGGGVRLEPAVAFEREAPGFDPASDNQRAFDERWRERVEPHENFWPELTGSILRTEYLHDGIAVGRVPVPKVALLLHGAPPDAAFGAGLAASRMQPASVRWAGEADAVRAARELTEVRGSDYVAFVRTDTRLNADWLNGLVNTIERGPDVAAAVVGDPPDARCTLVRPRLIPQHLRIEPHGSLDASLAVWLESVAGTGRTIARVRRTAPIVGPPAGDLCGGALAVLPAAEPFASIVMLSWNAPEYSEVSIDSIRAQTRVRHEIIVVDNGSGPETIARLQKIPDIRIIYNAVNTGFAFGCNQGLAAARGTHVVLLNNDVVVTDGWLETLLAVQQQNPYVGCSAPRTNQIAGRQKLDVPYRSLAELPAFAAQRALDQRGRWTHESRVIGFCMCLSRRVIEEIGGLDPRYGTGNFEDDDYCIRIRAAGYDIAMCEDSFIHHFGSASFRANGIDYNANHQRNMAFFAERWNLNIVDGLFAGPLPFHNGFVRERDYVPLPSPTGVGPDWHSGADERERRIELL